MGLERLARPALAGHPVAWFAPTYKYLTEVWQTFARVLRPVVARANGTERRLELVTGGVVEFWTLEDADAGRGRKYKRVVIDEAAKARNLEAAWSEAIRPTLADLKGDADFYSTPKGRDFFWRLYCKGTDPHEPEWAAWSKPTTANPYIDPAEVEAARRELPERVFTQEFLAEFHDDGGGVFRNVRASVDAGRAANTPPVAGARYALGVDLARVEDFTVVTALDAAGAQVYHERFNQISWERQTAAVAAVSKAYPGVVVVDSTGMGGDMAFEALRKLRVPVKAFTFTNQSKGYAVDGLAMSLERGHLRLMDVPAQTNELLAFEYTLTPARNVRMSAPEGAHDDCVMALALANWGAGRFARGAPAPPDESAAEAAAEAARRDHLMRAGWS